MVVLPLVHVLGVWSAAVPADADPAPVLPTAATAEVVKVTPRAAEASAPAEVPLSSGLRSVVDDLEGAPGLLLQRTGGEGAPAHAQLAGLGGRRVATFLGPARLDDPSGARGDLLELPLGILSAVEASRGATASTEGGLGGALRFVPRGGMSPVFQTVLRTGSEKFINLETTAGGPASLGGSSVGAIASARAMSTDGRFNYRPVVGPRDAPVTLGLKERSNNDAKRVGMTVLTAAELRSRVLATGLVDVVHQQGGLAGFGAQPLLGRRQEVIRGLGAGTLAGMLGAAEWQMDAAMRVASSRIWNVAQPDGQDSVLISPSAQLGARVTVPWGNIRPFGQLDAALDGALRREIQDRLVAGRLRWGTAVGVTQRAWDGRLAMDLTVRVSQWLGMRAPQSGLSHGFIMLPEWRLAWDMGALGLFRLRLSRAWRLPTMEELYRPGASAVQGNAGLLPEDGVESGAGWTVRLGAVQGEISTYVGRLRQAIAYVNINAFDVRPENISSVWRAGGFLHGTLLLGSFGQLRSGCDLNWTRVDATGAPLPAVPVLQLFVRAEAGPPRVHGFAQVLARSGARGNLHGELPIRPAARIDVGLEWQPWPGTRMRALVRNLADDASQTDLWGVPQPGREFFVSAVLEPPT